MIAALVISESVVWGLVTPLAVAGVLWLARRSAKGRNAELVEMARREITSDISASLEAVAAEQTRQHGEMRALVDRNHSEATGWFRRTDARQERFERDLAETRADVAYLRGRQERKGNDVDQ